MLFASMAFFKVISISIIVCSATETEFQPGLFATGIPSSLAAFVSMLSYPTPQFCTSLTCLAASSIFLDRKGERGKAIMTVASFTASQASSSDISPRIPARTMVSGSNLSLNSDVSVFSGSRWKETILGILNIDPRETEFY